MRILTPSGNFVSLREKWPLANIEHPRTYATGWAGIQLTGTATGLDRSATFVRLYKENPWVNAAVRALAWGLSRSLLGVYELLPDGQRRRHRYDMPGQTGRPTAGAQLDRLINGSHMRVGPQRRMRRTWVDYFVFGDALWLTIDNQITHVPWQKVTVIEGDHVPILGYEVSGTKSSKFYAPEDVVHFSAGDDPESPLGVPPMEALKHTLALHEALQRHLIKFFENAARPSANLKVAPNADQKKLEFMRDQIRELYASPENAGRVMVTTGDFQPITAGHDHSQIVELAKLSREEIAAVFRVPAPVLGILDQAIKSNVKELREQYIRDAIGGWAPAMEDDLMAQLVMPNPAYRHLFVEFDLDEHLRPDLESMAKAFKDLESTMSTNERRRKINLPDLPYPEADSVARVPGGGYLGFEPPVPPSGQAPEDADEDEDEDEIYEDEDDA